MLLVMFVIFRIISGFLPFAPMMGLFHWIMRKNDQRNQVQTTTAHIVGVYMFCMAVFFALAVTFGPDITEVTVDPRFNFVPFAEIADNSSSYVLNAVLFIPVGFLLPMVWKKFEKIHHTALWGFLFSLSIEISQILNDRVTDIDDLLMNTMGTLLGYFLFWLLKKRFPKISVCAIDRIDHWKWEPYACFCFAWLSMFFVQPFITNLLWGFFGGRGPNGA